MTTYTATAAPDGAVTIDAERACAGLHACLRILFLVSAHNSLSQRVWTELTDLGHEVAVAVVATAEEMEAAVAAHPPELIVCPMLKTMIPERVWAAYRCLVVHPGPRGDRGPSSLDWAIELGARDWGVTVLEANAEADAGAVWSSRSVRTRAAGKSSLYRHEVRRGRHQGGVRGGQPDRHRSEVGPQVAAELTGAPFTPLSAAQAARIGLIESAFGLTADSFRARLMEHAQRLAADPDLGPRLELKRTRRAADERARPLAAYRKHELERCHACFFGPDRSYHDARRRFVHKLGAPCATDASTQLRTAVKNYERHVLACARQTADAHAARDTTKRRRRATGLTMTCARTDHNPIRPS